MTSPFSSSFDDAAPRAEQPPQRPKQQYNPQQSFTPIQSRNLPQSLRSTSTLASLCPSMDLIALGLGPSKAPASDMAAPSPKIKPPSSPFSPSSSSSFSSLTGSSSNPPQSNLRSTAETMTIHRTVSWQRLLSLSGEEELSSSIGTNSKPPPSQPVTASSDPNAPPLPSFGASSFCWSPEGRAWAVGLVDGGIVIYWVEDGTERSLLLVHTLAPLPSAHSETPVKAKESNSSMFSPAMTRSRAMAIRRRIEYIEKKEEQHARKKEGALATETAVCSALNKVVVIGLAWAKMCPHFERVLWEGEDVEEDEEAAWRLRCHYLDRAECPPLHAITNSSITAGGENLSSPDDDGMQSLPAYSKTLTKPSCRTPLGVLCSMTASGHMQLYLHGKYLIVQIPPSPSMKNVSTYFFSSAQIVFSGDLTSVMVLSSTTQTTKKHQKAHGKLSLILYSIPQLYLRRHDLQQISATYCSITEQIQIATRAMNTAMKQWKEALQPLEKKLFTLRDLLRDYGFQQPTQQDSNHHPTDTKNSGGSVRLGLLHMILSGNAGGASPTTQQTATNALSSAASSATHQFFSQHLSDPVLRRITKTCETGTALTERHLRLKLLSSADTMMTFASELYGLATSSSSLQTSLIVPEKALELLRGVETLCIITHQCLMQTTMFRIRLQDLMTWFSSKVADLKANGTAMDSFERENARNKRVPDVVLKKIVGFLSTWDRMTGLSQEPGDERGMKESASPCVETENLLGISVLDYFLKDHTQLLRKQRSSDQTGALLGPLGDNLLSGSECHEEITPSIKSALQSVKDISESLFVQPCHSLSKSVERLDIHFHTAAKNSDDSNSRTFAVHKRVGLVTGESGGFRPRLRSASTRTDRGDDNEPSKFTCNHWIFVARGVAIENSTENLIQILAFPGLRRGWSTDDDDDDDGCDDNEKWQDDSTIMFRPPFYLAAYIRLPDNCAIEEITFYGDDGNSSLSVPLSSSDPASGMNNECNQDNVRKREGRQSLCLLIHRTVDDWQGDDNGSRMEEDEEQRQIISEELWLFPYDKIRFHPVDAIMKGGETVDIRNEKLLQLVRQNDCIAHVLPTDECEEEGEMEEELNDRVVLVAKRRQLRTIQSQEINEETNGTTAPSSHHRLLVSGSRGIGGTVMKNGSALCLFDLEEDEEGEDDDDSDDDE